MPKGNIAAMKSYVLIPIVLVSLVVSWFIWQNAPIHPAGRPAAGARPDLLLPDHHLRHRALHRAVARRRPRQRQRLHQDPQGVGPRRRAGRRRRGLQEAGRQPRQRHRRGPGAAIAARGAAGLPRRSYGRDAARPAGSQRPGEPQPRAEPHALSTIASIATCSACSARPSA